VIGTIVGQRYRIVRHVGAGGMGAVYEGLDAVTSARVAVKILTAEAAKDPTLMGRFEREARATSALATPHIVRTLDAGFDAGIQLPYLVMEFLDGEDVQQLIRRLGPLSPDLALRVVAQACLGLDRAHEARIIHRDIKPANFFLARGSGTERVVKLLDFGIAKIAREPGDGGATAGLTRTGSMLGSPLYMSPEQARGYKDIDHRSDVWSMGVVLYQALTGRTPHQDTDALGDLIIAICTEEPPTIQELAPWVPPEIAAIVHRAMRFDPDERYQGAGDMLDAIRPLLSQGWSIDETLFRPLTDADRGLVAPLLPVLADSPTRGGRTGSRTASKSRPPPASGQAPLQSANLDSGSPVAATSIEAYGTTVGERGNTGNAASPRRSREAITLAAGLAAVIVGGTLAYRVMRPDEPAPRPATTTATAAPTSAATADAKPRMVKLVILPAEATVEVDGEKTPISDGTIEIKGLVGSVHKVHVTTSDGETTRDVVVSESGAIPPKVEGPKAADPKPKAGTAPVTPAKTAPKHADDLRPQR
jgi:serine/threonine-protein kinase